MWVLEAIGRAVERWDAMREQPWYRGVGLVLGGLAFVGVLIAPTPAGFSVHGQRALALLVVMAGWWIAGVLPLAVTALIPLLLVPVLGLGTMGPTAGAYFDPLNFLMLGGFVLGFGADVVAGEFGVDGGNSPLVFGSFSGWDSVVVFHRSGTPTIRLTTGFDNPSISINRS